MNTSAENHPLTKETLRYFTGTENYYRHNLYSKYTYTDGVRFVASAGGAYWLIDKILICHACVVPLQGHDFYVWTFKRNEGGQGAKLTCTDGNENELYSENILFTDFPLEEITFFFQNNVLFLNSEY